jgi:hypothetical protein
MTVLNMLALAHSRRSYNTPSKSSSPGIALILDYVLTDTSWCSVIFPRCDGWLEFTVRFPGPCQVSNLVQRLFSTSWGTQDQFRVDYALVARKLMLHDQFSTDVINSRL